MLYKISSGSRPKLNAFLAKLPAEAVISSEEIEALIRERIMPAFRYGGSAPLVGARVTFRYVPDGAPRNDGRAQGLIATFRVNKGSVEFTKGRMQKFRPGARKELKVEMEEAGGWDLVLAVEKSIFAQHHALARKTFRDLRVTPPYFWRDCMAG